MIKIYKNLKKYSVWIILIVIFIFIQSMATLWIPNITADIINNGVIKQDIPYIWQNGFKMLAVASVSMVATIIASLLASRVGVGLGRDLRNKVFRKVEEFSLHEFDTLSTASLITRTTNDVQQVQVVTIMILRMVLSAPIIAIGGIILAVEKQPQLSLMFVVVLPILLAVIAFVGLKAVPQFRKVQKKLDRLNLVLREKLTGVRVIRAYNKDAYEAERFEEANKSLTEQTLKVNYLMAFVMPAMMLIMNVTTVAITWFGAQFIDAGTMQIGDILAFMQYAMQILFAFIMLSMVFIMIPRASASATRVNEVLDMEPEITDIKATASIADNSIGALEFKNVTFRYPGAEEPALYNINFTAKKGETTAIIGGTGSGKSTLMNLVPRFYDIEKGEICLNGVNIATVKQADLRQKLGYVPQKNTLFSGTITENIRYGKEDATLDEVKHAAKVAQALTFIEEKEEGFDSFISQGGTNVSGGQKQRLAIARALVRKPNVYLFDDSFSALDFKTDAKLRKELAEETKESVVLLVAQRVSTVMDAEQIIVLDDGEISASGTHSELMETSAVYKEIVLSQLSEEELA